MPSMSLWERSCACLSMSADIEKGLEKDVKKAKGLADEEASAVVRRIFSLCMQGKGVSDIATAPWEDKVLTPSAYKVSKGIGVAKKSEHPYNREPAMIASILENMAYIGITESFKSTRLGFKSRKRIPTAKNRRTYIVDAHTPIIGRDMWEKVQMLRENRHRPAKNGTASIFSGMLYCDDCGAKLSLATANG